MEICADRAPADAVGPRIAAGRDVVVHAFGPDRVLRRSGDDRSYVAEAMVMEHVRIAGFPVPQVFRVAPGEMVLERVAGPTMLHDLLRHPWRLDRHARTLAALHRRLHTIAAPPGLPTFPAPGNAVLHLDLHPGNVLLSPRGPIVIDWTNAHRGAAGGDAAMTWLILSVFEVDDLPAPIRPVVGLLRRRLTAAFLDAVGRDEAALHLRAAQQHRLADRHTRPAELTAVHALVERHARDRAVS